MEIRDKAENTGHQTSDCKVDHVRNEFERNIVFAGDFVRPPEALVNIMSPVHVFHHLVHINISLNRHFLHAQKIEWSPPYFLEDVDDIHLEIRGCHLRA